MEHLMQAGEAHRRLELRAGRVQDPGADAVRVARRGVQQHRLADSRVAVQQQRTTGPRGAVDERPKQLEIVRPADHRTI
ncbi:hypothetical protein GCM10010170_076400 [Dactylosporangium salmoneum]|uniref:Uncharacterized protein n=1 Tax=Dactylosporangium salmoneum TaxID=53361 RepID=A0ABP5UBN1_9ACTN